jgi:Thiol:disulfide interchange protein DsbD, N-terminal
MAGAKWMAVASVVLGAATAAWGQVPQVVKARMVLAASAAHPGAPAKAAVVAEIAPGYHINDHKPTLDYLIPTEVVFEPSKEIGAEKVDYPKGQLVKFTFADESLSVYEGTIAVGVALKVVPVAAPGDYALKGKLRYQACNDHACLPPASVPLELTVKVVSASVRLKPENVDVFSKIKSE